MRIRKFLTGLILVTLSAWVSLIAILKYFDPHEQNTLVFAFLYIIIFISLTGAFFLIDFLVRRIANRKKSALNQLKISLRQAIPLSLILTIGLYLQSSNKLFWWTILLLILAAILIEWLLSKIKYVN